MADNIELELSPKYAEESFTISYNFINLLLLGEVIVSATWTSKVLTGIDALASSMIVGPSDITPAPTVRTTLAAGVKGNTYALKCVITTATRTLAHEKIMVIR